MKKVIGLAVITLIAFNANAQLSYGPKLSLNLATQSWAGQGSDAYKLGLLPGIQLGAFGNYPINEHFAGQVELLYSMEGTTQKNKASGGSGNVRFNYLRIPILAQYKTDEGFYAETGPSVGIRLAASQKWNGEKEKIGEGYKSTDFGWAIGAGYDLAALLEGLSAGVRFYLGLQNITERDNLGGSGFKNRSVSIGVQYKLSR